MTSATLHTQHTLAAALEYAERGWPVFPSHGIRADGGCTCPRGLACDRAGKHPRISSGRKGATTDAQKIELWWKAWPDANVAIATGRESGIIVLDIDSEEAAAFVAKKDPPLTLEQRTGSGGTHLLFLRPDTEDRIKTGTGIGGVPGLDSRADGGYIIAPPSRHVSGGIYEWSRGVDPAPCPTWWNDLIHAPALGSGPVEAPEWNPDGALPPTIIDMLSHIPADDYTVWRDVGMALHYTDPAEEGFRIFDWWSSTSAKYDPDSVRREWRNWSRRGHTVARPVTLSSVRKWAEELGWTDPDVEHGAEVAAKIKESAQLRIAERLQAAIPPPSSLPLPPDTLIPERGLVGDIARWIEQSAIRPQPRLSLAAAASFVATLAGRRYASETNLRTNLYIVGLAPTGAGKNHARAQIQRLATAADVDHFLGADHIASGSAIVNSLKGQPIKLYMLDEFGLFLQSLTSTSAAGYRREIITRLLELYSLAQSSYRGTEYADSEARPRTVIHNPHVCVYGTSTGSSFWPALSGAHVLDGTLNRMLVIDTGDEVPPRRRSVGASDPPEDLVRLVKELATATPEGPAGGNLNGRAGHLLGQRAHTVPMTQEVSDAEYEFACEMDRAGSTEAARAIYSRVSEHAIKLSLLHAVSLDPYSPWIGPESWTWGRDVALWCANALMHHARIHISRSESEANQQMIYELIRGAGEGGLAKTALWRLTRSLTKRERDEALDTLEKAEVIAQAFVKPEGGKGRRAVHYFVLDGNYFGA